jgi:hypothetical protein
MVKQIYVSRRGEDGRARMFPFNYRNVVRGKNTYQNIELEPGATVVVA